MTAYARYAHAALAWLFVASVVVQVFLAGMFAFGQESYRAAHAEWGFTVIGLLVILVLVSALVARSRRQASLSALLLVLYVVQTLLPGLRASATVLAALHPVNALLLFALGVVVARRATADARQPAPGPGGEPVRERSPA